MDSIDEKVNRYIAKISYYHELYNDDCIIEDDYEGVRKSIKSIIQNNYDYLLTDSFIQYVCYSDSFLESFNQISDDIYESLHLLGSYIACIYSEINSTNKNTFTKNLDLWVKDRLKKIKKIFDDYRYLHGYSFYDNRYEDLVLFVVAYYIYNRRQDDIDELLDHFFNNYERILDGLRINGVFTGYDEVDYKRLIDYILLQLENRNIKEIK